MKGFKKVMLTAFCVICSFTGFVVAANEYDFLETNTVKTKEEAELLLEEQLTNAKEFESTLGECTYLEYSGEIISHKEALDKFTIETAKEKEELVNKYEEEGYKTSVTVTYDEKETTKYEFTTLNGIVTSAIINDEATTEYDGKTIENVLSTFVSTEEEDYKIVVSEDLDTTSISKTETLKLESEAKELVESLKEQGYKASYKQNNEETSNEKITSKEELSLEQIKENLQNKTSDKEIKDVVINKTTEPSTYTSEDYEDITLADNKKAEIENTGIYESVTREEKVNTDKSKATIVTGKTGILSSDQTIEDGHIEEVYESEQLVGYKQFYRENIKISDAVNDKVLANNFESEALCNAAKANYSGYTDLRCTKTSETTIESSTNNTINFNNTPQSERKWSHLDISVAQDITIIDKDGKALATVEGKLSNVLGYINKGTTNQKDLKYPSKATTDGGRLEYKTSDATIKNTDLVTITATVSYEYKNKQYSVNVTLVGYLNNAMNVCRENKKIGGGFDLEFVVSFTEDGKPIIKIDTQEKWTLTGDMATLYEPRVFYNEYEYSKLYYVVANDLDYTYEISYVATNYTVTYEGESAVYSLTEDYYDKNFVIEGEKTTYTVTTTGVIKEKELCGTGDVGEPGEGFEEEDNKQEEENPADKDENNTDNETPEEDNTEITPPHTGVETTFNVPTTLSSYFVTTIEDKKKYRK